MKVGLQLGNIRGIGFKESEMPPKKLTDTDKKEILALYRQQAETSATLAERYGVSTSTISRILKQNLPDDEYEELIHRKRIIGRGLADSEISELAFSSVSQAALSAETAESAESAEADAAPRRRQRRRSGAIAPDEIAPDKITPVQAHQLDLMDSVDLPVELTSAQGIEAVATEELAALAESELLPGEEFADDLDEDEDLEDDFEGDDDEGDFVPAIAFGSAGAGMPLQVLPLAEAPIPRVCYLVIDRFADLITRPLRDFGDLGDLPSKELQERILPVFDNHRVARRFSRRMQRIVKVPDGRVFHKVGNHLQAKGITRLLIDGQIYSVN
jgi:transposase-like protein